MYGAFVSGLRHSDNVAARGEGGGQLHESRRVDIARGERVVDNMTRGGGEKKGGKWAATQCKGGGRTTWKEWAADNMTRRG